MMDDGAEMISCPGKGQRHKYRRVSPSHMISISDIRYDMSESIIQYET
jgi:hypothetical protein